MLSAALAAGCGLLSAAAAGAGTNVTETERDKLLEMAKAQEAELTGEDPRLIPDSRVLVRNRAENDIRILSAAGQCLTDGGAEKVFCVIGENYMPEGSILPAVFSGGVEYSCTLEETVRGKPDTYYAVRFAMCGTGEPDGAYGTDGNGTAGGGTEPGDGDGVGQENASGGTAWADDGIPALHHWSIGDIVTRTLDGVSYRFCCIDQNYEEGGQKQGQSLALFLCESVIPANTGSEYVYEKLEDGSYGYVFHPGPIVNFGESSEYADSPVRSWLLSQNADAAVFPEASVGVEYSCMGLTEAGCFERFQPAALRTYRLGSQILTDRYFLLSVEEAVRYREYLWKVNGCDAENSAANAGAFDGAYWLRTPMGDGSGQDTGCVYVVDLVNGNIHPQPVRPQATAAADEEVAVTGRVGVRPAFVLRQRK